VRRIGVFCGSSPGARPSYAKAAQATGRALVARGFGLVYGGGAVGLMGTLASEVLAAGGEVTGVIPRALLDREVGHRGVSELVVVDSLFERKARMLELADGFLTLPGGVGTLDELFEVLTWGQLGYHGKPIGLLDVEGCFAPLLAYLDLLVVEGFLRPDDRARLLAESDLEALLDRLAAGA
jgi:uncharacterized protein (TIGR00730 family)